MKIVITLVLFLFLPIQAICSEENPLAAIEDKILAGDLETAQRLFYGSDFMLKVGVPYHYKVQGEFQSVIRYFDELARFRHYAETPGMDKQVILSAKNVVVARDAIPKDHHFSQALINRINTSNKENENFYTTAQANLRAETAQVDNERSQKLEAEQREADTRIAQRESEAREFEEQEARAKKICGEDYNNIKVGMSLKRVNDCVGETTLTGQIQKNGVTISSYRVNNIYLYVKNGHVAAWGKY